MSPENRRSRYTPDVRAWLLLWLTVFCLSPAGPCVQRAEAAESLTVTPPTVVLRDGMARQQILVETDNRDVTRNASFRSQHSDIVAVDAASCF